MLPIKFAALEDYYNAHLNAKTQVTMMATPCAGSDIVSNNSLCSYVAQIMNLKAAAVHAYGELSSEDKTEFAALLASIWLDS